MMNMLRCVETLSQERSEEMEWSKQLIWYAPRSIRLCDIAPICFFGELNHCVSGARDYGFSVYGTPSDAKRRTVECDFDSITDLLSGAEMDKLVRELRKYSSNNLCSRFGFSPRSHIRHTQFRQRTEQFHITFSQLRAKFNFTPSDRVSH